LPSNIAAMVRMWMAKPQKMCGKHLRAEYAECLMIAGLMKKRRRLDGWLEHNCIEPKSVVRRFAQLKNEMLARGYNATKSLKSVSMGYLPKAQQGWKIDRKANLLLLAKRCPACRRKIKGKI